MFPIPEICKHITKETKLKILHTIEKDEQGSKVSGFFEQTSQMFNEMKWQKKLKSILKNLWFLNIFNKIF